MRHSLALAFSLIAVVGLATEVDAQSCPSTPAQTEGPYYRTPVPETTFMVQGSDGPTLHLRLRVVNAQCNPIPWAWVAVWHADPAGVYDNAAPFDRYRATYFADANGEVEFTTIIPGLYPGRTKHTHIKVGGANTNVLTTQLYFPNVPQNATDSLYNAALGVALTANPDGSSTAFYQVAIPLAIICTPATITSSPVATTVDIGGTASFAAMGAGSSPRTYRWYRDGVELANDSRIAGATTATLTIGSVAASDAGIYTCGSHNSCGTQISAGAQLTVQSPCLADLNADATINGADLAMLLSAWGTCKRCASDITHNGVVDAEDLAILLSAWGPCS